VPGLQGRGVGAALKYHQRVWARDRGVGVITWTFDPLVRRNARFNLQRLGVRALAYLPDFYGHMADGFNADSPTDRLLVAWPTAPDAPPPAVEGAPHALAVDADGRPVVTELGAPRLACATPEDIVGLRRSNPALARSWSEALRRTLGDALAQGYRVEGLDASGAYVLRLGQ
jgi:predicted GNAT superfamily acetyltransferase